MNLACSGKPVWEISLWATCGMTHFRLPLFVRRRSRVCSSVCRKKGASFFTPLKQRRIWTQFFEETSLFLILFQTFPFGAASLERRATERGRSAPPRCGVPVRSAACQARVLYHLSCVVVSSLPVGVKQLTLAHVPPGGISSLLMRAGAAEVRGISVSAGAFLQLSVFLADDFLQRLPFSCVTRGSAS